MRPSVADAEDQEDGHTRGGGTHSETAENTTKCATALVINGNHVRRGGKASSDTAETATEITSKAASKKTGT